MKMEMRRKTNAMADNNHTSDGGIVCQIIGATKLPNVTNTEKLADAHLVLSMPGVYHQAILYDNG